MLKNVLPMHVEERAANASSGAGDQVHGATRLSV
jgi:hypothetical protein